MAKFIVVALHIVSIGCFLFIGTPTYAFAGYTVVQLAYILRKPR
jgi:hypothetical protein